MNRYYCLWIIVCLIGVKTFAQRPLNSDTLRAEQTKDLASTLEKYTRDNPQEKIHVHFDKDVYTVGDTVWYKIYVVNAYTNQLSALSKIVHIEVTNTSGNLQKIVLPVDAGMAAGYLILSAQKFKPAMYAFNVFTKLTGNAAKQFYAFDLNVGLQKSNKALRGSTEVSTVQFYPEGGTFVAGLRSKIVLKCLDLQGRPVATNGYVVDEKDNKVAEFKTGKYGMGVFAISPKPQVIYKAIFQNSTANKHFTLPKVIDSGYVLAVNSQLEDTLTIRISKAQIGEKEVLLAFQANGTILNSIAVPLSSGAAVFKVPVATLPAGLNEIVLFSKQYKLLANRFLFLRATQPLNNMLTLAQKEYAARARVNLNLKITDASGAGIAGGYSVAVSKANNQLDDYQDRQSIWQSLIFTPDTAGNIAYPNFSADGPTEAEKAELDLQLLTQRSGQYSWDDVLAEKQKLPGFYAERSLSIGGQVLNTAGKPMAGAQLNLFSAKDMVLIDTVADDKGIFRFENFTVRDSAEVVIRVKNLSEEKNVQIILDDQFGNFTPVKPDAAASAPALVEKQNPLKQSAPNYNHAKEQVNELKTVEIAAKRRPVIPGSSYPVAAPPPDYTIEAEELHKIVSLTDYLRSRFIGVKIINNKIIGMCNGKEGPVFILLNGLNIDDLSPIDPRSLTGVQIIKGGITAATMANQFGESMFGQNTCFGIIFLTSNHHNQNLTRTPLQSTGIIRANTIGFSNPKNFYAPNYANQAKPKIKDERNPLFWKPDVITGYNGMAEIDFYTSDETGRYRVTLEGIGINGQVVREVAFFTVK